MKENTEYKVQLKNIFVTEFSLKLSDDYVKRIQAKPDHDKYTFEVNVGNKGYVNENLLNTEVSLKVYFDETKSLLLGSLVLVTMFQIHELGQFIEDDSKLLNLPEKMEASLIGISLSHTRAVFVTKCAGTFLQNAILPIINPSDFLRKKS